MNLSDFAAEGQIWSGVKQAAGGLGSVAMGIGNVLGGVATGAVKGLDVLGGGSGDVGTASQRAERAAKQQKKQMGAELQAYDKIVPTKGLAEFTARLKEQGIDINNDKTFDRSDLLNQLRSFAQEFYAADPGYDAQTKTLNRYMANKIEDEPLPNTINRNTVASYLTALSHAKKIGLTNIVSTTRQAQSADINQQINQLASVIIAQLRSGKTVPDNLIKQFTNAEQLQQELYRQGVASAARTDLQNYVDQMLADTPQAEPANTTVPKAAPGMVNTITVGTRGGARKFFIDRRDQWYEYLGSDWPNAIETSRPVTDDATVDFLAKQVADGRLRQEPFGSPKKRRS